MKKKQQQYGNAMISSRENQASARDYEGNNIYLKTESSSVERPTGFKRSAMVRVNQIDDMFSEHNMKTPVPMNRKEKVLDNQTVMPTKRSSGIIIKPALTQNK